MISMASPRSTPLMVHRWAKLSSFFRKRRRRPAEPASPATRCAAVRSGSSFVYCRPGLAGSSRHNCSSVIMCNLSKRTEQFVDAIDHGIGRTGQPGR